MASFIAEEIREERGDDVYVSVLFGVRKKEEEEQEDGELLSNREESDKDSEERWEGT